MGYTTAEKVEAGFRQLTEDEKSKCTSLIEEASVIIDAYNKDADENSKDVAACRMIRRALGTGDEMSVPMGATTGSMSALGYSQSWTITNGSSGELYLSKTEKKLLGIGNRIGSHSPVEDLVI